MFKRDEKFINKEKYLFKNKISSLNKSSKSFINIKSKVLFRNKTINNIINNYENKNYENLKKQILSEDIMNFFNMKIRNINSFNKFLLKLPSLSDNSSRSKDLKSKMKRNLINKKFEMIYKNLNRDKFKRKSYMDIIMKSCCNVEKMNMTKNRINNYYKSFDNKRLNNKINGYKHIILYKNKNTIKNSNLSNCKSVRSYPLYNSYKKNSKNLVNAQTMTDFNNKDNDENKSNENINDWDFLFSNNIFNKYNPQNKMKRYFQIKTSIKNLNSNY